MKFTAKVPAKIPFRHGIENAFSKLCPGVNGTLYRVDF
jgi:hypothetical protein